MPYHYELLSEATIDKIAHYSGKPKDELQQMLDKANTFGWVEAFWRDHTRWYSMRIDERHVYYNEVDEIMQRVLERQYGTRP